MFKKVGRLRVLLVTASLILTSLTRPAPASAQAINIIMRFEDTIPFRSFNECTGEFVSGNVNVKGTAHITQDANGGLHLRLHQRFQGRAVGETSGTKYVGPQTDHRSIHSTTDGAVTDTFTLNFRFISKGRADNLQTHLLFHITVTADGVVRSFTDNFRMVCRG